MSSDRGTGRVLWSFVFALILGALASCGTPTPARAACISQGAWVGGTFYDGPPLCAADLNSNNAYIATVLSPTALLATSNSWAQRQIFPAGSTKGSINLFPGGTPSAPSNGDMWTTSAGLFVRINGSTVGPLGNSTYAPACVTFLTTPSSANLASCLTDETGSGLAVFGTAPTLSNATYNGTVTVGSASNWRTALGLGTAATQNTGTSGANVPVLNVHNTFGNQTAGTYQTISLAPDTSAPSPRNGVGLQLVGEHMSGENDLIDALAINGFSDLYVERYNLSGTFQPLAALDDIGGFFGAGWTGSGDPVGAGIGLTATENWSGSAQGTALYLQAKQNGTTNLALVASANPSGIGGFTVGGDFGGVGGAYEGPTDRGHGFFAAAGDVETYNHFRSSGQSASVTSCGAGASIDGNDVTGYVTNDPGGVTACTLNFHNGMNNPTCIVQDYANDAPRAYVVSHSGSAITVNWATSYNGVWTYICIDR